jgi:hypothetical protein
VLMMPGLVGGDTSTLPLRSILRGWGDDVHGFGEQPTPLLPDAAEPAPPCRRATREGFPLQAPAGGTGPEQGRTKGRPAASEAR